MIQFGSMPLMVVIEIREKHYMHQAQGTVQFQTMQSKKAQRREAAKAKKERRELMLEARALLKESTRADMKGDVEASQHFCTKAANREASATSLHAPTTNTHSETPTPAVRLTEVDLLEDLEAACRDLRKLMANAHSSGSPHPLRNYRRKYRKV